jgi:hypothetical protein
VGAGGSEDVYAVVLDHTELPQAGANVDDHLLVLDEGAVGVSAQLKVCPDLVLLGLDAIDHPLDALGLLVGLEQLARADGLCVAILAGCYLDNIEECGNIGEWAGDEAVLEVRVTARKGLALNGSCAIDFLAEWG